MNVLKRLYSRINHMNPKQVNLSILEFIFWATMAAYYPFVVVFLQAKGLSNTAIGTILSINSFIIVFAQPFWGMVSDRFRSVKKVFVLCMIFAALVMQLLPIINSTIIIALVLAIITIFDSPLSPLMDSWVIQEIRNEQDLSYGNIRLWGSLGYSIFAYFFGLLVNKFSINYNFIIFAVMTVLIILLTRNIKDEASASAINLKDMKIGKLLRNYSYITFLIFSIVIYVPHKASYSFLPNLLVSVGASPGTQGIASAVMAFSEIPLFLMSYKLLKRYKPIHLILISSLFFLLRQIAYLTATSPEQVILAQLLHGPSFALFLNGAVYYIDSLAPDELKSTAQTLATSLYGGVSGILANYGGGWVIDNLGIKRLYSMGIYAIVLVTLLFVASLAVQKFLYVKNTRSM
ncbi:MAG: MFS transporter [Caldicoprobacterales bacterium]|jgi:oligosaccharide:H+ symporter|nr:MFS transporter [Clostridiales bacterium]